MSWVVRAPDRALERAEKKTYSRVRRVLWDYEPLRASHAEIFIDVLSPPPRLVIVGGVHIAIPLVAMATTLGYRTIVVEPREVFARGERFPAADRVVSAWPDRALEEIGIDSSTAVAVLTHDAKLDDPALIAALKSPAFYVGALGSRKSQEKRRVRLLAAGLDEESLSRLHAPIGLPIGGRVSELPGGTTPEVATTVHSVGP